MKRKPRENHGYWRRPEYRSWEKAIQRTTNQKRRDYRWYGAKGIRVCLRWRMSFLAFLADLGRCPGPNYTLGRLDHSKPYEPGNCAWETWAEQRAARWAQHKYTDSDIAILAGGTNEQLQAVG